MANIAHSNSGDHAQLDEFFAAGDDQFLEVLLRVVSPAKLAALAERWKIDPRPWARRMLWAYLDAPWSTPGHNVLVKRLYKQAERTADYELVAAFAHRFDGMIRRELRTRWDWRENATTHALCLPANSLPGRTPVLDESRGGRRRGATRPGSKQPAPKPQLARPESKPRQTYGTVLFSARTRYYLRRRATRLLRRLGHTDPEGYLAAATQLLARYRDDDLANGQNILDSWCLLHVCYRAHPALEFGVSHVGIREGHSLQDLTPAPRFLHAYGTESGAAKLWQLLTIAPSRLVQKWSIAMLQQEHPDYLQSLQAEQVRALVVRDEDELVALGIQLLRERRDLHTFSMNDWLLLLHVDSLTAQQAISELLQANVALERFSLAQVVSLCCAEATPIASLGLKILRARSELHGDLKDKADTVAQLSEARCRAVAADIAETALAVVGSIDNYHVDRVIRFFDSPVIAVRRGAWSWLRSARQASAEHSGKAHSGEHAGRQDPELWTRLLETPHEADRLELVRALTDNKTLPGTSQHDLVPLWSAVLLGIHRGGRHKIQALHQLSRAAAANPQDIAPLLPVFAVAIRSVRAAEARIGLAALVAAVEQRPELRAAVEQTFPELRFVSDGASS